MRMSLLSRHESFVVSILLATSAVLVSRKNVTHDQAGNDSKHSDAKVKHHFALQATAYLLQRGQGGLIHLMEYAVVKLT